jgi:4-hydroxybenzoate polyprenyltransferase
MIQSLLPYFILMRFDRPIGTFLLLWPALIALFLAAGGIPDIKELTIFVFGVIIMRAAGCVINDFADRNFDPLVVRTKNRPLAKKQVSVKQAMMLFTMLMAIAFCLALNLSKATLWLSCIAGLLAMIYPFAKRFTKYPQFILGCAFAWSIPMAYMQVQQHLTKETWILFISIMCWVVAYDTQYALADKQDDLKIGIKSTAITFGRYVNWIILLLQMACLAGFSYIAWQRGFSIPSYTCILCAFSLALYQQMLLHNNDTKSYMAAFLNNNYFGAILFLSIIIG